MKKYSKKQSIIIIIMSFFLIILFNQGLSEQKNKLDGNCSVEDHKIIKSKLPQNEKIRFWSCYWTKDPKALVGWYTRIFRATIFNKKTEQESIVSCFEEWAKEEQCIRH